jgi:Fe-S cluster biogenesis protein NfuA
LHNRSYPKPGDSVVEKKQKFAANQGRCNNQYGGLFGNKIKDMNTQQIEEKVLLALDEIRPFLASDGGDISLVSIEDDKKVKVQLHGACVSCTVNQMTLKTGVEMTIKKYAPQINEVVSVDPV